MVKERGQYGMELVVPAHWFGEDWKKGPGYTEKYPAGMVEAGLVDRLRLVKYDHTAVEKGKNRYLCIAQRESTEKKASKTYLNKEEVIRGMNPELLVLLDVRVEQLDLEVDMEGHVEFKVEGMRCLECNCLLNCYVGDSYLCRSCVGPHPRIAYARSSLLLKQRTEKYLRGDDSDEEDEADVQDQPPRKRARSILVAPAALRRVCSRILPLLADRAEMPDVAAFSRLLMANGSYLLSELVRILHDIRTGIFGGLVMGVDPRDSDRASFAASIVSGDRAVDSSDRSFSVKVSYTERAVFAAYAHLAAKYGSSSMEVKGSSIRMGNSRAVTTLIPPSRLPIQAQFLRKNKYRQKKDNPYAQANKTALLALCARVGVEPDFASGGVRPTAHLRSMVAERQFRMARGKQAGGACIASSMFPLLTAATPMVVSWSGPDCISPALKVKYTMQGVLFTQPGMDLHWYNKSLAQQATKMIKKS